MYLKLVKVNKNTIYLKKIKNLNVILSKYTLKKNTIIFMGAGSISTIAKEYIASNG